MIEQDAGDHVFEKFIPSKIDLLLALGKFWLDHHARRFALDKLA